MSKHLPPSINISLRDKEDLNLQLHVSNHVLLQVLLNRESERMAKEQKIPLDKAKEEINKLLAEARVILLAEIDALYGGRWLIFLT